MGNFTDIEESNDTDLDLFEENVTDVNDEEIVSESDINRKLCERRRKIEERDEQRRLKEELRLYDDDI